MLVDLEAVDEGDPLLESVPMQGVPAFRKARPVRQVALSTFATIDDDDVVGGHDGNRAVTADHLAARFQSGVDLVKERMQ